MVSDPDNLDLSIADGKTGLENHLDRVTFSTPDRNYIINTDQSAVNALLGRSGDWNPVHGRKGLEEAVGHTVSDEDYQEFLEEFGELMPPFSDPLDEIKDERALSPGKIIPTTVSYHADRGISRTETYFESPVHHSTVREDSDVVTLVGDGRSYTGRKHLPNGESEKVSETCLEYGLDPSLNSKLSDLDNLIVAREERNGDFLERTLTEITDEELFEKASVNELELGDRALEERDQPYPAFTETGVVYSTEGRVAVYEEDFGHVPGYEDLEEEFHSSSRALARSYTELWATTMGINGLSD